MRIKAFFGTSENPVKTHAWIAIAVYVLVTVVKKRLYIMPRSIRSYRFRVRRHSRKCLSTNYLHAWTRRMTL